MEIILCYFSPLFRYGSGPGVTIFNSITDQNVGQLKSDEWNWTQKKRKKKKRKEKWEFLIVTNIVS